MSSTMASPPHRSSSAAGPTLTPESLPSSPTQLPFDLGSSSDSHSRPDPHSTEMATAKSALLPPSTHVHLDDPLAHEEADPMLAAAYLLSFMREQGANVGTKPRTPATGPAVPDAAVHPQQQSQQDVALHDAITPVLEPAIPPGLPSTMDLGDRASQPTLVVSTSTAGPTVSSPGGHNAAAAAPGSGTGVLIPSTTKKSSTRCKSLPSVLEYPDYLIPLNAPIQHKTASQSLSQSQSQSHSTARSSSTSLPEPSTYSLPIPAISTAHAVSTRGSDAPATPGRSSRKRARAAAASSDEGELTFVDTAEESVKRARMDAAGGPVDAFNNYLGPVASVPTGSSRDGSPTMDSDPAFSSSQPGTRGRKGSRRVVGPAPAASTSSASNSSAAATPTATPQLGRPTTAVAAAAAKAANDAFLKEVVPDLSSLDPKEAKRVRNTLSARASRARKAAKIEFLETRVNDLEAMIDVVVEENATLRKMLADAGVTGVPEPAWSKMPGAGPWPEQFRDSAPLFIGAQSGAANGSGGEGAEESDVGASQQFAFGGESASGPQTKGAKGRKAKSQGRGNQDSQSTPSTSASVSISVSAPGSVDGDVHMDDYQQFDATLHGIYPPGSVPYQHQTRPVSPNLTAPVPLPPRPTSPSSASQSFSSSSSAATATATASGTLPPISAVVGDLPYPPASMPQPPLPLPRTSNPTAANEYLYPPSYSAYSGGGSASHSAHNSQQHSPVGSSPSGSPVRAVFQMPPPPSSALSTPSR